MVEVIGAAGAHAHAGIEVGVKVVVVVVVGRFRKKLCSRGEGGKEVRLPLRGG